MGAVNDDALNLVYNWPISSTKLGFVWPSGRPPRLTLWRKSTRRGCLVETWLCPQLASSNCQAAQGAVWEGDAHVFSKGGNIDKDSNRSTFDLPWALTLT